MRLFPLQLNRARGTGAGDNAIDMLHGPLARPMLVFALPLIVSGVLQQAFNSVDVAVASRWAGPTALAAVGANGPVLGLMVNLFLGLAVGLNVVIANHIGAGNREGTRQAVAASMPLAAICGTVLVIVGETFGEPLLRILGTPPDVMPEALEYLRILMTGCPFLMVYNFGAAILRSIGDTRRPFYALLITGVLNVALSVLFVTWFGMGIAGVAWATVVSTGVNGGIVVWWLLRETGDIRLDPRALGKGWGQMRRICTIGLPAGLQSTVFSFSNVFVLSAINSYGSHAMAGSAAAVNFEFLTYYAINAFGQTAVAFTGQNHGAGNYARCVRVFTLSLLYSTALSLVINLWVAWRSDFCIGIFTDDPVVAGYARDRIASVLVWQFIACYYEMAAQSMRGVGRSLTPALITIFGTCLVRVVWVLFLPEGLPFGKLLWIYPITWVLTTLMMGVAHRFTFASIRQPHPAPTTAS